MDDSRYLPEASADTYTVHQGNSRNLRTEITELFGQKTGNSEFLDVTITSPPYADMIDYETDDDRQIGFGDEYGEYLTTLRDVFAETYALTKPSGSLWIVVNTFRDDGRFVDLPGDIVQICENLQDHQRCTQCETELEQHFQSTAPQCPECQYNTLADSWQHHDTIIWDKVRARPYAQNTFRNVFEYILCFTKTPTPNFDFDQVRIADESRLEHWWVDWPERYHPRGKIPDNVWEMVTPTQGGWNEEWPGHPAPFPPELVERIVQLTTDEGDFVFDPFAGSGTTIAQSKLMGRRSFGFDISEVYIDKYEGVYNYLEEMWNRREENEKTLELQQERLERTIWALRQLIYAKKAATKLRKHVTEDSYNINEISDIGLHSILVDSAYPDPQKMPKSTDSMETMYTYVFDSSADGEQYLEFLRDLQSKDPWSGFGIDATVTTASIDLITFSDLPSTNESPYLYTEGQHERVARRVSESIWANACEDPTRWRYQTASSYCPAIISNLWVTINRDGQEPEVADTISLEPPNDIGETGPAHIQDESDHLDTSLADFS